ncbi:MAG: DUF4188 domain-containing protein [Rubrobacteraceae bacterium]
MKTLSANARWEREVSVSKEVMSGRFTARTDESFVVFVMGVRVNRVFAFRSWVGLMWSLRSMLRELRGRPETGFLGGHTHFCWRGVTLFQYWNSYKELEKYSRNPDEGHMPGWQKFNRRVRKGGAVGLWHEAYLVGPGCYEAVYADVPMSGLARATTCVPAFGGEETRRRRDIRNGTNDVDGKDEEISVAVAPEVAREAG